jgi:hypothetical protein
MDEAQLSARRCFRELTGAGHLPLIKAETKLPRVTELCTISAAAVVFKSIIILKDLKSLISLVHYPGLTSFASSCSGWITGDVFTMFTIGLALG